MRSHPLVDELAEQTLSWFVLAALGYRALVTLPNVLNGAAVLGPLALRFVQIAAILTAADIALLLGVAFGSLRPWLQTRSFLAADLMAVAAVNLWGAWLLPDGVFFLAGRDVFYFDAVGTVVLWTAIRGPRTGLMLAAAVALLVAAMAVLNGATFDAAGSVQYVARLTWVAAALALALMLVAAARRSARVAVGEGLRAGQETARADALRALHDGVLQTLSAVQLAVTGKQAAAARLEQVRQVVQVQAQALRAALRRGDAAHGPGSLRAGLDRLAYEFHQRGLHVDIVTSGTITEPYVGAFQAVLEAVREALNNVHAHAKIDRALVNLTRSARDLEITVLDKGCGFDANSTPGGYGLTHSIKSRISEVGGSTGVWSALGQGTQVRLTVPLSGLITESQGGSVGSSPPSGRARSGTLALMAESTLTWFSPAPLTLRAVMLPVIALGFVANVERAITPLVFASSALLGAHVALLAGMAVDRVPGRLLRSAGFFFADLAVACAFCLWAASILLPRTAFLPGHDMVWTYVFATIGLWTVLRGPRTGAVLIAGGVALGLVSARVNGMVVGRENLYLLLSHLLMLVTALLFALLIMALARQGAKVAVAEGVRAGREAERADALRVLHDNVLETLDLIARRAAATSRNVEERLVQVGDMAVEQAEQLRAELHRDELARSVGNLGARLEALARDSRRQGLRVELVAAELETDPPEDVVEALAECVREALDNVRLHSDVAHVVVRAAGSATRLEVIVRDQGLGSDEPMLHATARRMSAVGGGTEVWSAPGRGTRVRMWWEAE